jgi:hypothetical protein
MKIKTTKKENHQPHFFKYFTISASLFLLGLGTVIYVNLLLPPSAEQEALALMGIILSIPSGIFAIYCYIRLLIARLQYFMNR